MASSFVPSDRSVCFDISKRQARSFDFLACEGYHGWSATHAMFPFVIMLFFNDLPLVWIFSGFVEIFEILRPSLFGHQPIFDDNPTNYETHAGAIIGDWLLNDLMGILCALLLLRMLGVPGLADPWYKDQRSGVSRPSFMSFHWWKIHLLFLAFLLINILPSWVIPEGCDLQLPYECINIGLMLSVCLQLAIVALAGFWFLRTKDDYKYLWRPAGVSRSWLNVFFVFWFLFILLVGSQNAQPVIPIWFIPLIGEWAQVWLAIGVWILIFLAYYAATDKTSYRGSSYRRAV